MSHEHERKDVKDWGVLDWVHVGLNFLIGITIVGVLLWCLIKGVLRTFGGGE